MEELIKLFGTLNVVLLGAALLNFFLKYLNRAIILKLPKTELIGKFANEYRRFMRYMIIHHRWFGIAGGVSVLIHFLLALQGSSLPTSGIIAGVVVIAQLSLGIYGYYIKKGMGLWKKIHRINGFILLAAIINHLVSLRTQA
jgi:hypothetical protein